MYRISRPPRREPRHRLPREIERERGAEIAAAIAVRARVGINHERRIGEREIERAFEAVQPGGVHETRLAARCRCILTREIECARVDIGQRQLGRAQHVRSDDPAHARARADIHDARARCHLGQIGRDEAREAVAVRPRKTLSAACVGHAECANSRPHTRLTRMLLAMPPSRASITPAAHASVSRSVSILAGSTARLHPNRSPAPAPSPRYRRATRRWLAGVIVVKS